MKNNQYLFITLLLPLALSACGKSEEKATSGVQTVSQNAIVAGATAENFPIEQHQGQYRVTYYFYENGCHTGRHRVTGFDHESTRQRLCHRLQDDWKHRGCARNLRFSYFTSMCSGITWNAN